MQAAELLQDDEDEWLDAVRAGVEARRPRGPQQRAAERAAERPRPPRPLAGPGRGWGPPQELRSPQQPPGAAAAAAAVQREAQKDFAQLRENFGDVADDVLFELNGDVAAATETLQSMFLSTPASPHVAVLRGAVVENEVRILRFLNHTLALQPTEFRYNVNQFFLCIYFLVPYVPPCHC